MDSYEDETLSHLKEVLLMILKDFIEICEENNLEYYAYAGTALGAIRHSGFIPWDDDIDVIMFREDYEKFLDIMESKKSDKYTIFNVENTDDFHLFISKMSLNGTEVSEMWTENVSYTLGINIDIFVFDYIPPNKLKWYSLYYRTQILKKIGWFLGITQNEVYVSDFKKYLGKILKVLLKIFRISNSKFRKSYSKLSLKTKEPSNMVYDLSEVSYKYKYPVSIFKPIRKVQFETIKINMPNDYNTYLTICYGDYMTLPPEEERENHFHEHIDFGKY